MSHRSHRTGARAWPAALGCAVILLFGGCAQPGTGDQRAGETSSGGPTASGTASPGAEGSGPPTVPSPTTGDGEPGGGGTGGSTLKPPKDPTDNLPTDVLVGRIVAVGTGCYTLETDDDMTNTTYALYGVSGQTFKEGDTVRVTFEPLRTEVERCPGTSVQIVKITKVG